MAEVNIGSKKPVEGANLRITWVKSAIGHNESQKQAIRSLGLTHLNETVEHPDSATLRGQMFKVKHLIRVEQV